MTTRPPPAVCLYCRPCRAAAVLCCAVLPCCRKVVVQYREECRLLDADPRLASSSGAREQQEAMQVSVSGSSSD